MKRTFYLVLCLFTCMAFMTACGDEKDKAANSQVQIESQDNTSNNTDAADKATEKTDGAQEVEIKDGSDLPVEDATDGDSTEAPDNNNLTIPQQNVAESPQEEFHASGTFNGFVDSSSVEITMTDGSYQTFFVYDEDVYNKLMVLSENETPSAIQFVYKAKEGQVNPEIVAVN